MQRAVDSYNGQMDIETGDHLLLLNCCSIWKMNNKALEIVTGRKHVVKNSFL